MQASAGISSACRPPSSTVFHASRPDVDATAEYPLDRAEELGRLLVGAGFEARVGDIGAFARCTRVIPLGHLPTGAPSTSSSPEPEGSCGKSPSGWTSRARMGRGNGRASHARRPGSGRESGCSTERTTRHALLGQAGFSRGLAVDE